MAEPVFEWDQGKARANLRKHGVAFELAALVFRDVFVKKDVQGDEHGEIRWQATGQVGRTVLRVIYTTKDEEEFEIIRLISARKATRSERRAYERVS